MKMYKCDMEVKKECISLYNHIPGFKSIQATKWQHHNSTFRVTKS